MPGRGQQRTPRSQPPQRKAQILPELQIPFMLVFFSYPDFYSKGDTRLCLCISLKKEVEKRLSVLPRYLHQQEKRQTPGEQRQLNCQVRAQRPCGLRLSKRPHPFSHEPIHHQTQYFMCPSKKGRKMIAISFW